MAEDTATMGLSLDEPGEIVNPGVAPPAEPPAAPPAEPPATPPAAAAAPPVEDPDPEGTIAAANGERYVPLSALQAERGKRKDADRTASAKDTEIAGLKQKAQAYDETRGYLEQARPYIEALRANPNLVKQAGQPPAPPQEPAGPLSDAEAVEHAKALDLYTTDGKPDTARAQAIAKMYSGLAAKQAQQMVAPLVQTEAQRQSTALYQRYLATPEVNGIKIDPRFLSETWNTVPAEMIAANPNVGEVLFRTALATQLMSGHKPTAAPPPPLVTEGVGAGAPAAVALNAQSERMLSASGIKRDTFTETRNSYKPGQHNSLE